MGKEVYGALRLKRDTLEDLKDVKLAFESTYMERFSFDKFIRKLVEEIEDGDPAVWETLCLIREKKESEKKEL